MADFADFCVGCKIVICEGIDEIFFACGVDQRGERSALGPPYVALKVYEIYTKEFWVKTRREELALRNFFCYETMESGGFPLHQSEILLILALRALLRG